MRMRLFLLGTVVGTTVGIATSRARRWYLTWGVDPGEAVRSLPGDGVVGLAKGGLTRGIDIDAPPEAVWPWLLQMGYGRAGWYSYDQLDQRGRSAERIEAAWQDLSVGDIVPTHPGGGFEVAVLEPCRALVLRSDTSLVTAQAKAAAAAAGGLPTATSGVKLSGTVLSGTPQQFAASWAFVLEPRERGGTRLIERFRIWYGGDEPGSRLVMPFMGFGVFVMMQKQMVGIRGRAERLARTRPVAAAGAPSSPATPVSAPSAGSARTGPEPATLPV